MYLLFPDEIADGWSSAPIRRGFLVRPSDAQMGQIRQQMTQIETPAAGRWAGQGRAARGQMASEFRQKGVKCRPYNSQNARIPGRCLAVKIATLEPRLLELFKFHRVLLEKAK